MSAHGDSSLAVRELLCSLEPDQLRAVLHLLSCPECRQLAERAADPSPTDYSALWLALEQKTPGLSAALQAQQAVAQALYDQLLGQARELRLRDAKSEPFRHLGLAEMLLAASRKAQPREIERSRELAQLALAVARQFGVNERADAVRVEALCLEASALRLKRDLVEAEALFRTAAFQITSLPAAYERGVYCRMLAELRRDQGRSDEALALLWRAGSIFREAEDRHAEGEALGALGESLLAQGDEERARAHLARAWSLIDPRLAPARAVTVGLSLALCEAEAGRAAAAHELLGTAKALGTGLDEPAMELAWRSLEARVLLATEAFERAAQLLEPLKTTFFERKQLHEAALTTLDLALGWAKTGRAGEVHGLLHELAAAFPLSAKQAGAVEAIELFVTAVDVGFADLAGMAARARALLRRFHHNPVNAARDLHLVGRRVAARSKTV